jgi:hypothetical protein
MKLSNSFIKAVRVLEDASIKETDSRTAKAQSIQKQFLITHEYQQDMDASSSSVVWLSRTPNCPREHCIRKLVIFIIKSPLRVAHQQVQIAKALENEHQCS